MNHDYRKLLKIKSYITGESSTGNLVAVLGSDPEPVGGQVVADELQVARGHTDDDI